MNLLSPPKKAVSPVPPQPGQGMIFLGNCVWEIIGVSERIEVFFIKAACYLYTKRIWFRPEGKKVLPSPGRCTRMVPVIGPVGSGPAGYCFAI
jgi:hypothetical protein